MTATSTLDELRPGLGRLARALATGEDRDIVAAARSLDLGKLAAILDPPNPILVPPCTSGRRKTGDPTSAHMLLADRLMRLAANPRVDLTTYDRDFIVSAVTTLRTDQPLSERQAAKAERLFKIPRRRLS